MAQSTERLYNLLPGIYRQGDMAEGGPLRALLAVLERELDVIEHDIEAAYDNWFVQTCDVWALPYLADVVGLRAMERQRHVFSTQRRQVANAVAYGRRKGTLGVLEHVLRDVTGWHLRAVELARHVAGTPRLSGVPAGALASVDLRRPRELARLGGAFDAEGYSADVRAIAPAAAGAPPEGRGRAGRHNLGRVGIFVWRLRSYTLRRCPLVPIDGGSAPVGFPLYALDPGGRDTQLFNQPAGLDDIAERLEARHIPLPITRVELGADLDDYRAAAGQSPDQRPPASAYYGPGRGLAFTLLGEPGEPPVPIPPHQVASVDLDGATPAALGALRERGVRVAVDPELGRLALLDEGSPDEPAYGPRGGQGEGRRATRLVADYTYGFSAEIGGGPYHRRSPQEAPPGAELIAVAYGTRRDSLRKAIDAWDELCRRRRGEAPRAVIRILDNGLYDDGQGELRVTLPPGAELAIVADNGARPTLGAGCRLVVSCDEPPTLGAAEGALVTAGEWAAGEAGSRLLRLDGLRIDGGLRVEWREEGRGGVARLGVQIRHCTIAPRGVELDLAPSRARATLVELGRSIVGPLRAPPELAGVVASDSIIDGAPERADLEEKGDAVAGPWGGPGPPCALARVTVFGSLRVAELHEEGCLVAGRVRVGDHEEAAPQGQRPRFTATRLGDPGYGQLHHACPETIRRGAADGGELGALHHLHHAQAADNLAPALDEYLPLGLEAGIFYVT